MKVAIIEDEPLARKGLEDYIKDFPMLELCGVAEDPVEAFELLAATKIDLIFLDIEMPKMSGITFLQKIKDPPLVIICSAHAAYALEGFELDVIDYLLKPVSFERFAKAVAKAQDFFELRSGNRPAMLVQENYFYVKCDNCIEKIELSGLLYLEASGNYVTIHTEKHKFITYLTLKSLEEFLPAEKFIRVHKSFLVPAEKIDRIDNQEITIANVQIPVSKTYRDDLLKRIQSKFIRR